MYEEACNEMFTVNQSSQDWNWWANVSKERKKIINWLQSTAPGLLQAFEESADCLHNLAMIQTRTFRVQAITVVSTKKTRSNLEQNILQEINFM